MGRGFQRRPGSLRQRLGPRHPRFQRCVGFSESRGCSSDDHDHRVHGYQVHGRGREIERDHVHVRLVGGDDHAGSVCSREHLLQVCLHREKPS